MLTPNDSDFYQGTGNWAGLHPDSIGDVSLPPATSSVRLNGSSGTYIVGPDLAVAGAMKLEVVLDVLLDDWTPAIQPTFVGQSYTANNSWVFGLSGTGFATMSTFPLGTNISGVTYTSSAPVSLSDGTRHLLGFTWLGADGANSSVQPSLDGVYLGTSITHATLPTGLFNSSLPTVIGSSSDGVAAGSGLLIGNIYGVKIYANDVLVASPDFTLMASGQTSVIDDQGNTWTLHGSAAVVDPVVYTSMLAPGKIFLTQAAVGEAPPSKGRGSMRVWTAPADVATQLTITVGDGIRYPNNDANPSTSVSILPSTHGIPVTPGANYGFSVSVRTAAAPLTPEPILMYFDRFGYPSRPLSIVRTDSPEAITDLFWNDYYIEGVAPAGATFVVPGVLFSSRPALVGGIAPYIYLCGAMVYLAGDVGTVVALPPDRYLTLGDPSELIGSRSSTFDPFLIGAPRTR
jgi:hypothetical protein